MKALTFSIMILLVGTLVACHPNTSMSTEPQNEQGSLSGSIQGSMLTQEEATELVNKEIPGGTIIKLKQDFDDAIPSYEFKVVKGNLEYELEINAYDGTIRGVEKEVDWGKLNHVDIAQLIGDKKAKEIAMNQVPQGTLVDFEYEGNKLIPIYEITIRDTQYEYEFEIDARTGEILKSEQELIIR